MKATVDLRRLAKSNPRPSSSKYVPRPPTADAFGVPKLGRTMALLPDGPRSARFRRAAHEVKIPSPPRSARPSTGQSAGPNGDIPFTPAGDPTSEIAGTMLAPPPSARSYGTPNTPLSTTSGPQLPPVMEESMESALAEVVHLEQNASKSPPTEADGILATNDDHFAEIEAAVKNDREGTEHVRAPEKHDTFYRPPADETAAGGATKYGRADYDEEEEKKPLFDRDTILKEVEKRLEVGPPVNEADILKVHETSQEILSKATPKEMDRVYQLQKKLKDKLWARVGAGRYGLLRTFKFLDKDNNDRVDFDEFKEVLNSFAIHPEHETLKILFAYFDDEDEGSIDYYRFISTLTEHDYGPHVRWDNGEAGLTSSWSYKNQVHSDGHVPLPVVNTSQRAQVKHHEVLTRLRDKIASKIAAGSFQIRKAFKFFDKDGNGEIDRQEFEDSFHELGMEVDPKEMDEIFALYDVDGSEKISYYEFIDCLLRHDFVPEFDHPLGKVNETNPPYEYRPIHVDKSLANKAGKRFSKLKEALVEADTNYEGKLTHAQFIKAMQGLTFLVPNA
mmetsp:Transcript_8684/g.23412  ORF Transcript_8684/g.23412 Transcript_8684/m.23412 type:complete len:561 (+) Transcript_8684:1207-2889(+)